MEKRVGLLLQGNFMYGVNGTFSNNNINIPEIPFGNRKYYMYVLFISTILLLATGRKILVLTLITAMTSVLTSQLVKREAVQWTSKLSIVTSGMSTFSSAHIFCKVPKRACAAEIKPRNNRAGLLCSSQSAIHA